MKRVFATFFCGFILLNATFAQVNVQDSIAPAWVIGINFSFFAPGGNLADRFGEMYSPSINVGRKTQSNWIFGAEGSFYFGTDVKNIFEIFGAQTTAQGYLIGLNGEYSSVQFQHRGWHVGGYAAKILPLLNHNPNSGLFVKLGVGYLQNRIFVRNPNGSYPQYNNEYGKGYDRLHAGLALRQEIGYLHSGNNRTVNFLISLDFMQGFTSNVREFNWDEAAFDTDGKLDLYFGLRIGWFLPIYDKNRQKFFYY